MLSYETGRRAFSQICNTLKVSQTSVYKWFDKSSTLAPQGIRIEKPCTLSAVHAALGMRFATLSRHVRRQAHYAQRLDECAVLVDAYRREQLLRGISRDRFTAGMLARGRGIELTPPRPKNTHSGGQRFGNQTRGLLVTGPDQVWFSDTTYYRTADATWAYLTFVLDVYTREILGYAASASLGAEANVVALRRAIKTRGGARLAGLSVGVIFHTDGGKQFAEHDFLATLRTVKGRSSMGFVAEENAFAERVNGIIKGEFLDHWPASGRSLPQLRLHLAHAVDIYNRVRLHDGLPGHQSPAGFVEAYASGAHRGYAVEIKQWNHDPYASPEKLIDELPPDQSPQWTSFERCRNRQLYLTILLHH